MQTKIALRDVTAEQMANVVIAYEPIWAIGTGKTATATRLRKSALRSARSSARSTAKPWLRLPPSSTAAA